MEFFERIDQLEHEPNIRRWNDLADDWYVFEDVLEYVFQIKEPISWLNKIKSQPESWELLSKYLVEFRFEDDELQGVEMKYCITLFRLWEFLFFLPKFKALNCSQRILPKIRKRHEKHEINFAAWNSQMVKLGRRGELRPEARRAVEFQLMSGRAKAAWWRKQEYNVMSGIDRWLYDVTKLTVAQAVQEAERSENIPAAIRETKKRMKNFSRIVKFELGISF